MVLHGVALGPASEAPLDERRAARMARLCGKTEPLFWSEHLAFVRGGGLEIGHLAAPPRTPATVDATARNLACAAAAVGARPLVENIATLIDPPGSVLAEPDWLAQVVRSAGVDLLLDLLEQRVDRIGDRVEVVVEDPRRAAPVLLVELDRARAALAAGRERRR